MRRAGLFVALALVFALLVYLGDRMPGNEPVRVTFTTVPDGTTTLDLTGGRPGAAISFPMVVESGSSEALTLTAVLEEGPERMTTRVWPRDELLPQGTLRTTLQFRLPTELGPFRGRVKLSCPEFEGWSTTYEFKGSVEPRPLEGRYLRASPTGVVLGEAKPADVRDFVVALESFGDEDVTVSGWAVDDEERVNLERRPSEQVIVPGGRFQLRGRVRLPKAPGPYRTRLRIRSDAQNIRGDMTVPITAQIVPDYAPRPAVYGPRVHYPVRTPELSVVVAAREGVEPFAVAEVTGHERFLELVEKGGTEPAGSQTVKFRLRADAPTDVQRNQEARVRLRLEPVGEEVTWKVVLRLLPPVYPQPHVVNFGRVGQGVPAEKEIRLATFGVRDFEVKRASAMEQRFAVLIPPHARGMQWKIRVGIPNGTPVGLLQDVLVIETTDPDVPEIRVPLRAVITEDQ